MSRLSWPTITAAMSEERPMLEAPATSLLVLLLGVFGLLGERAAVRIALRAGGFRGAPTSGRTARWTRITRSR
jgi:hypothetical protein